MAKGGGAWKVAYADFITAMMALFMVLWILGSEQEFLDQLQEYFRNPPSPWDQETGKYLVNIGEFEGISRQGDETAEEGRFSRSDPTAINGLITQIYKMLNIDRSDDEVPPVEAIITSDGLRMIMYDRSDTPMFNAGSNELTQWGDFMLQNLAWVLSRQDFEIVVEGHSGTDVDVETDEVYGPWELSLDRANIVRKRLEIYAGGSVSIKRVTGYGDRVPLEGGEGSGRTNQRITLSISMPDDVASGGALQEGGI